ncbi:hypothetical protein A45J_2607 [hot springs metagenome]|uniref:SWIM-type domain-containing protein n=1 Tax=hot springs metagenome TaxID=433727 RepID=A0A5J4L7I2_9ZZZZ
MPTTTTIEVLDAISPVNIVQTFDTETERRCHACREPLGLTAIECPECGAINIDRVRRRRENNRPERQVLREIVSPNYNGSYRIFRNSDGSLSCNCLSFLFQRGVQNGLGFSTCKHIRDYLNDNPAISLNGIEVPSDWQIAALKRLGVEAYGHLTNAQAYFVFHDLLTKQGVEYKEYERLLRTHGRVNILPIYSFGVELEMNIRSREELKRKLTEAGIDAALTGYTGNTSVDNPWRIGTDGSIRIDNGFEGTELVSPKLFGADGFATLKKVLYIVNDVGTRINKSCGFHVHIDAWNWDTSLMLELAKIWAKIEIPFLWYLVSPKRRNNNFCKAVDTNYLLRLAEGRYPDRYYSLNVSAFHRHRTLEFRLHNGTTDPEKILPWIIFLLKLVDSVKKGLKYSDITDSSFNGITDAIGMDDSAISVVKEARNRLYGRYMHWKEDAERNPNHIPQVQPIDPDSIEEELQRRARQAERDSLMHRRSGLRWTYSRRTNRLATANSDLPSNSVQNLASRILTSGRVIEESRFRQVDETIWAVPSRSEDDREYSVALNPENDTLTCGCRGFRQHGYCYHTINLARFLTVRRQTEEIERRLAELSQGGE